MSTKLAATNPMPTGIPSPGCSKRRDFIHMNCLPTWEQPQEETKGELPLRQAGEEGRPNFIAIVPAQVRDGSNLCKWGIQICRSNFPSIYFFLKSAIPVKRNKATCNNMRYNCRGLGLPINRRIEEEAKQLAFITHTFAIYSAILLFIIGLSTVPCFLILNKRMVGYSLCSSSIKCAP